VLHFKETNTTPLDSTLKQKEKFAVAEPKNRHCPTVQDPAVSQHNLLLHFDVVSIAQAMPHLPAKITTQWEARVI